MNIVNMQIMAKGSVIVKNIAKTGLLKCFDRYSERHAIPENIRTTAQTPR